MSEKFFMLTEPLWEKVNEAQLTAKEYKVWLYLSLKDPFGDRWCDLPSTEQIINLLKISQSTFYRAIAKLTEFKIIESEDKGFRFKNILAFSKMRNDSQICETIPKNENPFPEMRKNSQICENRSPEAWSELDSNSPQTLQTKKDYSYVSNCETHTQEKVLQDNEEKNGQEIINESSLTKEKITDEIANSINQNEDKFFRDCSIDENNGLQESVNIYRDEEKLKNNPDKGFSKRSNYKYEKRANKLSRTQRINWQWMPEGAWNINGKLDPAFQEWLAKRWLAKHKDILDIYEAKANVLAYFCNKPEKLPIRWEEYQAQFIAKADNIKTRLDHECKIKEQEKKNFLDRLSALKPLDESQSVSANQPIQANNLVLNQYHQLTQSEQNKSLVTNKQSNIYENQSDADVKIVIEENDVIVETKQSSVNTSTTPIVNIYAEDQYGAKIKSNDFTGCHQQEQIPVNKNAINAIADWLKAKKGGRK